MKKISELSNEEKIIGFCLLLILLAFVSGCEKNNRIIIDQPEVCFQSINGLMNEYNKRSLEGHEAGCRTGCRLAFKHLLYNLDDDWGDKNIDCLEICD